MIQLAEAASAVRAYMTQPHRLEMFVDGERRRWIYFPDIMMEVESAFLKGLDERLPFGSQLVEWRPSAVGTGSFQKLVIEVKDDRDERMRDPRYVRKLELAASVYARLGIRFLVVVRSRDIDPSPLHKVRDLVADAFADFTARDRELVHTVFSAGNTASYGELCAFLGGGPKARAKLHAMHVDRILALDVRRLDDGSAVLRFPGGKGLCDER